MESISSNLDQNKLWEIAISVTFKRSKILLGYSLQNLVEPEGSRRLDFTWFVFTRSARVDS